MIPYQTTTEEIIGMIKVVGISIGVIALFFIVFFSVMSGHFIIIDLISPQKTSGGIQVAPSSQIECSEGDSSERGICKALQRIADSLENKTGK